MTDNRTLEIDHIIEPLSNWKTTGIEPSRHAQESKNTQLDVLARIFTQPEDTCVALCLWRGKLLIANNRVFPSDSARKDLEKWQKFIQSENSRLELGLNMLRDALEKSHKVIENSKWESISRDRSLTEENKKDLKEFEELSNKKRRTASEKEISPLVEKLFRLSRKLNGERRDSLANSIWDLISPIDDVNKMMKLIHERKLDPSLLDAISNSKFILLRSKNDIHAEMKIIDHVIYDTEKQQEEEETYLYVGIGKLCCLPCQKVIDVINLLSRFRIGVPGTHGKTYRRWKLLEILRNNHNNEYDKLKAELERIRNGGYSQFVRESTCYLPEKLVSLILEESFIAQQQQS